MVFFNDQLTQQTPPVADKLPVIGQVSSGQIGRTSELEILISHLVFHCFFDDNFNVNDKYHLLPSIALYARPE